MKVVLTAVGLTCVMSSVLPISRQQKEPVRVASKYRVTDLGTLEGCDSTYAESVNDSGVVAGYAYRGAGHGVSSLSHPFVWQNGELTELRKLGGEFGQAYTINVRGDIGGYAQLTDYTNRPVIWRKLKGYAPEQLHEENGRVLSILDDGSAVGDLFVEGKRRAAKWKASKVEILGDDSDVQGVATCANRSGIVAGYYVPRGGFAESMRSPGTRRAAMWRGRDRTSLSAEPSDSISPTRAFAGGLSQCNSVNDAGLIVGMAGDLGSRRACTWRDGKLESLPGFGDAQTEAHSINRNGDIVGEAMNDRKWFACIWQNGTATDLNSLIPADSGWTLSVARCISNRGLIVGYGSYDKYPEDHWRAFLLTPLNQ